MADASDAELLKRAFKSADKRGNGRFARKDLAKLFRELEDWTDDDLDELFDSVDTSNQGVVDYVALIDWIMQDDDGEGPGVDEGDGDEDSDDDDADHAQYLGVAAAAGLDLGTLVTMAEWEQVTDRLDMDAAEADSIYAGVQGELAAQGRDTAGGVPVVEFLDDLDINPGDQEGVQLLADALAAVRRGDPRRPHAEHVLDIAGNKVALKLRKEGKPPEEAWSFVEEGTGGNLSNAGRAAVVSKFSADKAGFVAMVKQFMVTPPLIPASAGMAVNRERCCAAIDEIVRRCRASGERFVDPGWDVTKNPYEVLYVDKQGPGHDCTVGAPAAYKRLSEVVANPRLFKGGVHAGDIKQGQIGTCFLLGALGAIAANKEEAIKKAFIKYDMQAGVYGVRFCVDGEWEHVIVDDLMPVDQYGRLMYARSADPEELWVPILEKAYCKLNTCYEMCDGGRPNQAIYHICGGASGKFMITDKHRKEPSAYFDVLANAKSRGWLLTTTFVIKKNAERGGGKCGEAVLPTGLVGGHVYSVLQVVDACGVKLIQCRNPWGTGEWKGKYSDENASGEWTPELKAATGWTGLNDGKFWMSIQDFVDNSSGVEYARTFGPQWKKITTFKTFQQGTLKATANWAYAARQDNELSCKKGDTLEVMTMNPGWWYGNVVGAPDAKGFFPGNYVTLQDRPVARFDMVSVPCADAKGPATAVVMLMQPNVKMLRKWYKRKQDGKNYKDVTYSSIQLVVIGPDGKVAFKRQGKKRSVSGELVLKGEGTWKVYALSLDGRGHDFTLRTYIKDGSATLTEVAANISEVKAAIGG